MYHHLREVSGLPSVAIGYRKGINRSLSAFPGGQLYQLADLTRIAKLLDLKDPILPKPFPIQGLLMFPMREAYSGKFPTLPLEYMRIDADKALEIDEELWFRPDLVYERVSRMIWGKKADDKPPK